jgi:transposase
VHVGIDVHRRRSQVAVVDSAGVVLKNRNVVNGVETVLSLIGEYPTHTPVAFEAAYGWGWLVELLDDYGYQPHLVHPTRCKAIASARLKNDKVDAATLAQLLRADLLPEAWIAPPSVRQLRALLRHRVQLVRLRTLLRNRIHAEVHAQALADPRVRVLTALPGVGSSRRWSSWPRSVTSTGSPTPASSPPARRLGRVDANRAGLGPDRPARAHLQAGLDLAALDLVRGGADRQAAPRLRRSLRRDGPPPRQEDRHHGGRAQAPHPRLPPAHRRRRSLPPPSPADRWHARDGGHDDEQHRNDVRHPPDACTSRDGPDSG